jgi:amino acid adenylation domain-containing protein/thioester reductase-like protein
VTSFAGAPAHDEDIAPGADAAGEAYAFPLSFAQQRLWFLDQLEPGTSLYNVPSVLRLRGALDADALCRALGEIVDRHEALRTVFRTVGDEAAQVVGASPPFSVARADVSHLPVEAREAEMLRVVGDEARRPFDLARGPVVRALLVRLADDEAVLALTFHHIVGDGWSLGVIHREMAALYAAFAAGAPSPLDPPALQYADVAIWQRETLQGEALDALVAYWRDHLAGAPASLDLPTDHPRPTRQRFEGATHRFRIARGTADGVAELARRLDATPYMVLLAAFKALLGRWAGQDDLVVGTPIANRTEGEMEDVVGFFVNTLALRTRLDGDPSFRDLVARVRETTLGAYAHQDLPFERLVDALGVERDRSRGALFQVMFLLQNTPLRMELSGLALEEVAVDAGVAKFDLSLAMQEDAEGIAAELEYATALWDAGTAETMAEAFATLLAGAVAAPDTPLSRLPLLRPWEADALHAAVAGPAVDAPFVPFPETIRRRAAEAPDRVAISFGGREMTYGALDALADRFAAHLADRGAGPEVLVGVCLERSPEMVAAVLGILRAGAAYVPLDPAYPPQRLAYMVDDTRAPLLVTSSDLADGLHAGDARLVLIDREMGEIAARPAVAPTVEIDPAQTAYVIYTSGSTGRPKGVVIHHGGAANEIGWAMAEPAMSADDVMLAITTLSFDIHVTEIWGPLTVGARVELVPREIAADGVRLRAALEASGATRVQATPVTWRMLLAAGWTRGAGMTLLTGAEALAPDLAAELLATGATLWNQYGPTEITVWCSVAEVVSGGPITIGHAAWNTDLRVLDPHGQAVPVGVFGELYIGGAGVARGYLGRPGLTAERFVPDPYAAVPGARVYRTGDRIRFRGDGALDYSSRLDNQVKLRGFRIELGEVECALREHPAVAAAVAIIREDVPGDQRLVAYVVAREGEAPTAEALRAHLGERLLEQMVPSAVVFLAALPETPSGKVDRRALPAPDASAVATAAYVAPATETERMLAETWAALLHVERVGADDSFFALGGHSLLATQLVARVRHATGLAVPLRDVYEARTLAAMAARIDAVAAAASASPATAATRPVRGGSPGVRVSLHGALEARRDDGGDATAHAVSHAQRRLWFLDRLQPGTSQYNLPAAVRIRERLDVEAMDRAVRELARRHEPLRTVFRTLDGEPVQVVLPPSAAPLPVRDLSHLPPDEREREMRDVLEAEGRRPFDLAAGPLFRPHLVRLADDDWALALDVHHVVSDAWSHAVLLRELPALYRAFAAGEVSPLAEPAVRYADWTAWQNAALEGDAFAADVAWWREALAGASGVLELPTDRPRPAVPSGAGARHELALPPETRAALVSLADAEGATPFMALLAAYQLLLGTWAGEEDVVVGTPVSGRTLRETEELAGFFVNTLALRGDLRGAPSFRALLRRAREHVLSAYAHQDVPFDRLVEELRVERDGGRTPLFQAMFVFQSVAETHAGAAWEPIWGTTDAAKFDLTLVVTDGGAEMGVSLDYATDLFAPETMARFGAQLASLLAAALAAPDAPVASLPWLPSAETERLAAWSAGGETGVPHLPVHRMFEAQAARAPHLPAVVDAAGEVAYGALNARANRLARRLRALGAGPESVVAVAGVRGTDAVAGILAVLKAGAAYLPLDPSAPADHLAYLVTDAGAALVLATEADAPAMAGLPARLVLLEEDDPDLSGGDLDVEVDADALAYVIYTSGSTGRPKGVMVPHGAVSNLTSSFVALHGFRAGQRVLVVPPLTFDASVGDLFPALATGMALVFHPAPGQLTGPDLLAFCRAHGVTVVDTAAALWSGWADGVVAGGEADVAPLEMVMMGGEAVSPERVARWAEATRGAVTLVNHYGPTEATVCATLFSTVDGAERAGEIPSLPIGRPVHGAGTYVVDAALRPVPQGVAGELCIGGRGVTRGYRGRPGQTAAAFVPDPFSAQPGARMYRTGDRVRWLPDGTLEFLGRRDDQVKIRGFRIEPGEVEQALLRHPDVAEAVVAVREDEPGRKRLVAYAVLRSGDAGDAGALRAFLAAHLPEHMVPAAIVLLPALPLTAHGKVDRRALPAPARGVEAADAPHTETERRVADLWRRVLGVDAVGRSDGFFELGGHSLLALPLVAAVREELGAEIPLRTLFTAATLARFAGAIDAALGRAPSEADAGDAEPSVDLAAEATLPDDVRPAGRPYEAGEAPRRVLLTGATGFLGAFLLRELLARTPADVYCLVRAADAEEGRRRVADNLARYFDEGEIGGLDRVVPVIGDLASPRLGLSPDAWDALAEQVDAVYHNGGLVHFALPYEQLRGPNVAGTLEVLRLACARRTKAVHFVSTLGLFVTDEFAGRTVAEADAPGDAALIPDGYTQSKWVADRLVAEAARRGVPVTVHRPARIGGAAATGAITTDDFLARFLRTLALQGMVPEMDWTLDVAPVDQVARAVVTASLDPACAGRAFHYHNPRHASLAEVADALRAAGFPVRRAPYAQWRAALLADAAADPAHPLTAVLDAFPAEGFAMPDMPLWDTARADAAMAASGDAFPPADAALLGRFLAHFARRGFLAPPAPAAHPLPAADA